MAWLMGIPIPCLFGGGGTTYIFISDFGFVTMCIKWALLIF